MAKVNNDGHRKAGEADRAAESELARATSSLRDFAVDAVYRVR